MGEVFLLEGKRMNLNELIDHINAVVLPLLKCLKELLEYLPTGPCGECAYCFCDEHADDCVWFLGQRFLDEVHNSIGEEK